jgi:RNA polymerase sigma factor (sigma-70 family)
MATDLRRPPAALDSASFDRFYRRHLGEIYRFVLQDVGNRADAEEVTQNAFLDAFRALSRGHEPEMPRAWMYGIARNATRRRFRTLARRPREVELAPSLVEELAENDEGAWAEAIRSAFAKLKQSHRDVLFLREVEGLSYAEIADRMRLSQSAVETLLFRARRSLRELFDAEGVRPAVQPSRFARLKGLALLPAAFVGKLSDRTQQLLQAELATKTAGAVAAVALGTGVVVGTQVLPADSARSAETTGAARSAAAASDADDLFAPPAWLERSGPRTNAKPAKPGREKADRKHDGRKNEGGGSDRPGGGPPKDGEGTPQPGGGGTTALVGGGSGSGSDGGGGSLTTPPISLPPVEVPPVPPVPPVDTPPVEVPPVETPPVEVPPPPVEVPPVETPPVEVPPVEVELPVDPSDLIGG